jgi:signal peptidase II
MLAVGAAVVALDQAVKAIVVATMAPGERTELALGFDLVRVSNSGIAFGFLDEGGEGLVLAITLAALALVLTWFVFDSTRPGQWLGVGLLIGGAVGNLIDRVRLDAVTDFFDPPLWPAFNIADVAITLGVVTIAVLAFITPTEPEPEPEPEPR